MPEDHEAAFVEEVAAKPCEFAPAVLMAVTFTVMLLRDNWNKAKSGSGAAVY